MNISFKVLHKKYNNIVKKSNIIKKSSVSRINISETPILERRPFCPGAASLHNSYQRIQQPKSYILLDPYNWQENNEPQL